MTLSGKTCRFPRFAARAALARARFVSWVPALLVGAILIGALLGGSAASARAAGFAHDENFVVLAPDQPLADMTLGLAARARREIARAWLGTELPAGAGKTVVHLRLTHDEERGLTWAIDHPQRTHHKVWVAAPRVALIEPILRHELTHTVLATAFPAGLPKWCDEGVASQYDDSERQARRQRRLFDYERTGRWPELARVLAQDQIAASDADAYAVAASLAEYLAARGQKTTLPRFAADARALGYDAALRRHYGLANVGELEQAWRRWARSELAARSGAERR